MFTKEEFTDLSQLYYCNYNYPTGRWALVGQDFAKNAVHLLGTSGKAIDKVILVSWEEFMREWLVWKS